MEHIIDTKITKIYEGPNGESEYGPWQVYNLYLDKGDKKKFGYMQSGKKPIPKEGMNIKHIEYEIEPTEKDGKTYENYKIKKLELAEDQLETRERTQSESKAENAFAKSFYKNGNKDASFYVSYAKDLQIALIQADPKRYEKTDLGLMARAVVTVGLIMADMVIGKIPPQNSEDTPGWEKTEQDIPEPTQEEKDRELRRKLKEYYKLDQKLWLKTLNAHTANKAEDVVSFEPDAQQAVLHDLAKEFKMKL